MNTMKDFIALLHDEVGLLVTEQDTGRHLDQVVGWDSVHLLSLLTLLERRTGRVMPFADILDAQSLHEIYALAVSA